MGGRKDVEFNLRSLNRFLCPTACLPARDLASSFANSARMSLTFAFMCRPVLLVPQADFGPMVHTVCEFFIRGDMRAFGTARIGLNVEHLPPRTPRMGERERERDGDREGERRAARRAGGGGLTD